MSTSDDEEDVGAEQQSRLQKAIAQGGQTVDGERNQASDREDDYLCVRIGARVFALLVREVAEVVPPGTVTVVPHTPPYVPGVLSMHGRVVAVLDFGIYVGEQAMQNPNRIVVIRSADLEAGVPVSEVVGIHSFVAGEQRPALPEMTELGSFVQGHFIRNDKVFIVLDVGRLLDGTRHRNEGASSTAAGA